MTQHLLNFPELSVQWIKNIQIPMRDGITLAADACLPDDALMAANGWGKLPVVLEYIPYRKNEVAPGTRFSEALVRKGYIVVRVDIRGTGDSEGITTDEYLPVEQQDGYDCVEWLAQQEWCDGQVNMLGISYGGFTALQVACLQPPHLRSIIPVDFTDNRYTDDCHYCGGLLRMFFDVTLYGNMMAAYNAMPPFPEWAGEDWERIWNEHLAGNQPYMLTWLQHQQDGAYWRNGSVIYTPERIQVPVFLVGGWKDGYPNSPLRLYQALNTPKKVLVGPWNHAWPDKAIPGPRIDFIHEVARWLDFWCKGLPTGILDEPPVQVFMQEFQPPLVDRLETSGQWRAEAAYPPPGVVEKTLYLGEKNALVDQPAGLGQDALTYHPQVGTSGGLWSGGIMFGLPEDQRSDEALSLTYTSAPLAEDLAILGESCAELHVSTSAHVLGFVARISDLSPEGTSVLVAKGVKNATRRASLEFPQPVEPGKVFMLEIPIDCTGWIFRKGQRIRLSISNADFPNLWPTPELATSQVWFGGSRPACLRLPAVPLRAGATPTAFLPSPLSVSRHSDKSSPPVWEMHKNMLTGAVDYRIAFQSESLPDQHTTVQHESEGVYRVLPDDPAHASAHGRYRSVLKKPGFDVECISEIDLRSTGTDLNVDIQVEVMLNGKRKDQRQWTKTIPRELL